MQVNSAQAILPRPLIVYSALEPSGSNSTRWPCEISCFPYICEGKGDFNGLFLHMRNLIFYCCSSDDLLCFIYHNTHFNKSFMHQSLPLSPPEVIEELSLEFWIFVPFPQQDLDHRHGLRKHCGIQHWFQSVAPRASEQVLSRRASDKCLSHTGGPVGWKTSMAVMCFFINMFRWSVVNLPWDIFYCWISPEHQQNKASLFSASRDWRQVQNTM